MLPREQQTLFGHIEAERQIVQSIASARLPHAWLIVGEEGVGKATLAYRFARFLLSNARAENSLQLSSDHPTSKLVANGSHPDLLVLEKPYDEKKGKFANSIPTDAVRTLAPFFHQTSSQGSWRVVLIDGADSLNRNAQNALLKTLEEPPERGLLILTAENTASLLPTIRSRCRVLKLEPLTDAELRKVALQEGLEDNAALDMLIPIAEGSASRLLRYAACEAHLLFKSWCEFLGKPNDYLARLGLAETWAGRDSEENYRAACDLIFLWLHRLITAKAAGQGLKPLLGDEKPLVTQLYPHLQLDRLLTLWEKLQQHRDDAEFANLDRKIIFLSMLSDTAEAVAA